MLDEDKLRTMLTTLRGTIGDAVAKMPTHKQFLDSHCLVDEGTTKTPGPR
jgi:hypothetical protein